VDLVITADDTTAHKPDPEPFLLAARQLGLQSASCLVVGDSPWDVLAGMRAGMVVALAEWGMFDPAAFEREGAIPDFRLRRPKDLLALCEALAAR
jgi:pyrophosphatase PpaX